jgi:protein NRD1
VGFGPRDCSDYNTGISVIPISRLTDADRKWVLTAEYGGTGGVPLEEGMVIEEPDIEIGAGVSSKGEFLAPSFFLLFHLRKCVA